MRFQNPDQEFRSSDAEGRFTLVHLPGPTEPTWITADLEGHATARSEDLPAARSGHRLRVELTLSRGNTVRGELFENAEPAVGADLRWRRHGEPRWRRGAAAGSDGTFVLANLPDGTIELAAFPHLAVDLPIATRTLELPRLDATPVRIEWTLHFASLGGRVRTADGEPAADVLITVMAEDDRRRRSTTRTDADGRWALELPTAPSYAVGAISVETTAHARGVRPDDRDVLLTLPATAPIVVALVDDAGAPIPDGFVELDVDWSDAVGVRSYDDWIGMDSNGEGLVHLPTAPDLRLLVTPRNPAFAPTTLTYHEVHGGAPGRCRVTLRRRPITTVRLMTEHPMPAPVQRAHVFVLLRDDELALAHPLPPNANHPHWELRTDDVTVAVERAELQRRRTFLDGETATDLPAGTYKLRAFPDDLVFEPATVTVPGPTDVTVTWRHR